MTADREPEQEDDVRRAVRALITRYAPAEPGEVADGTRLLEDLDYHSLALLQLAVEMEDELGLPPWEEANWEGSASDIRTVRDMEDLVLSQLRDRHGIR